MNAHTNPADLVVTTPKAYRVDWAVTLNATSPGEAAGFASEIQDQQNTATVFSVTDMQTGEITVHDLGLDGVKGTNIPARRPEDTTSRRSLRPGGEYRTRTGLPVEILSWEEPGEFPLAVRIMNGDGDPIVGCRTKAGLHPTSQGNHDGDVLEVNPTVTRWMRVYDRKLNEAGKQVVGGKEFAAERGLFLYIFDTEEEARANLRGVRAVFPVEYRDGEGLG